MALSREKGKQPPEFPGGGAKSYDLRHLLKARRRDRVKRPGSKKEKARAIAAMLPCRGG